MKQGVNGQMRVNTPSNLKNNQGTIVNVTRKIVDANGNNSQPKKQIIVPTCKH